MALTTTKEIFVFQSIGLIKILRTSLSLSNHFALFASPMPIIDAEAVDMKKNRAVLYPLK